MNKLVQILLILIVCGSYIAFVYNISSMLRGRINDVKVAKAYYSGDLERALNLADLNIKLNPDDAFFRITRGALYAQMSLHYSSLLSEEEFINMKKQALSDFEAAYAMQPNDIETIKHLAEIYHLLGIIYIDAPDQNSPAIAEPLNDDNEFKQKAIKFYEDIEKKAGTDAGMYLLLAKQYDALGKKEKAAELYRKTLELTPRAKEAQEALAK